MLHGKLIFDRHGTGARYKVLAVPHQEGVDVPDMAAVVLFAGTMSIQEFHQLCRMEELLCFRAAESLFYDIVIFVLAKPDPDRHGESQLLFLGRRGGQITVCRLAESRLGVGLADLLLQRKILCNHIHAPVKEGNTALQPVGHTHLVSLEENISLQPEVEVDILHLLCVRKILHPPVIWRGQLPGVRLRGDVPQHFIPLFY